MIRGTQMKCAAQYKKAQQYENTMQQYEGRMQQYEGGTMQNQK